MYYFMAALVCAVVGTLPLLIGRKIVGAAIQATLSFFLLWAIFYCGALSTVWPFFGAPGICVLILWIVGALIVSFSDESETGTKFASWAPSALAVGLYLGGWLFGSSEIFNASDYANMIGPLEKHQWTQDVQPKDPKHMRMSNQDNAVYLAQKALGQDGSIGSQFQVEDDEITLQMVKGELWYVAPLEFKSYSSWSSTGSSPGYIMVSAENPDLQPIFVKFLDGQGMQYSLSAYFDHDLERHLRNNGYLNKGLTGFNFEVDESGKAWWIVTVFTPTIMWSGEKVTGVVIVDPATGDSKFYPIGEIPNWVDRVVPSEYVQNYLTWHGSLAEGWWNSFWAEQNITQPGDTFLIYSEAGDPEWVTDISSNNSKDSSLIGLVYTNSRTGKSVYYQVPGGSTNDAVLNAVNNNPQINYKHLHGADPQLYNVYGSMAAVVPLFNDSHGFQGVAIASINDVQHVAMGANQFEALREYEKLLSGNGQRAVLAKNRDLEKMDGIVDRFSAEPTSSGNLYYIHLVGVAHLFTGSSSDSAKLPVTQKGDHIKIEYYDSDRDVVPLNSFNNLSLPLSESKDQKETAATVVSEKNSSQAVEDSRTVKEEINNLSPEDLQKLRKQLPKKP